MGKNHRHKKMLKSEKAKIKLKVKSEKTKFLPKGLNETKTDFKIKPIVLPEQLKQKDALELLSNRKLNVKDILSRLRHHNLTVRHDSLNALKQIINAHIDELASQHLAQIMHGLPPLLLDDNRGIRQTVMSTFQKILEQVPGPKIKPFFPILSSYLRCSMTNLNRGIQEDSLGFLAILLKSAPDMIADEKHKVLPNLFALISKFKLDTKPGRTLSINLNTKLTSVKWHIQVLSGIYGFLKAINIDDKGGLLKSKSFTQISANRNAGKHVPLIYNSYVSSKLTFNREFLGSCDVKDDVIEKNLSTLIALLYEIWVEVAPEMDIREFSDFVLLNNDTAAILSCILNVMHLLLIRVIENNEDDLNNLNEIFFTKECKNLLQSVLASFPFTKSPERTKQDNPIQKILNDQLIQDNKFVRENLLICFLFCNFKKRLVRSSTITEAERVLKYIEYCLTSRGCINKSNIDCLLLVIRTIFFDNIEWHRKVDIEHILIKFVTFYDHVYQANEFSDKKNKILDVLCEVSQLSHLNRNSTYQSWLGNITESLGANQISENIVNALLLVGKQNNAEFLDGLRRRMPVILENYGNITISNVQEGQSQEVAKLKILCLFYYLPHLGDMEITALRKFKLCCRENSNEKSVASYLLEKDDLLLAK